MDNKYIFVSYERRFDANIFYLMQIFFHWRRGKKKRIFSVIFFQIYELYFSININLVSDDISYKTNFRLWFLLLAIIIIVWRRGRGEDWSSWMWFGSWVMGQVRFSGRVGGWGRFCCAIGLEGCFSWWQMGWWQWNICML